MNDNKFTDVKKIVKISILVLVVIFFLALLDLYSFQLLLQDPGPYVVARRSGTVDQVIEALTKMDLEELKTAEIIVLRDRFQTKRRKQNISVEERFKWKQAYRYTDRIIRDRKADIADTSP